MRDNENALIRAGAEHVISPKSPIAKMLARIGRAETGRLPELLERERITVKLVYRSLDVNEAFGK